MRVAEQWKVGHKGLDNGAILLVSRADRKVRIEVGYGLEGRLTDLQAGRIIRGSSSRNSKKAVLIGGGERRAGHDGCGERRIQSRGQKTPRSWLKGLVKSHPLPVPVCFSSLLPWAGEPATWNGGWRIFHALPWTHGVCAGTGDPGCLGRHRPSCRFHAFRFCRLRTRQRTTALRQAVRRRIRRLPRGFSTRGRIFGRRRRFLRWWRRIRWRRSFRQLVGWGLMGLNERPGRTLHIQGGSS